MTKPNSSLPKAGSNTPPIPTGATEIRVFGPAELRFSQKGATLRLTLENECSYPNVTVVSAFPLSLPKAYWSVLDGDRKEIGMILDPAKLDPDDRAMLEVEMDRRYMVPHIVKIKSIRDQFGFQEWEVETSRGTRTFTTRDLRDNARQPSPGRYMITDTDGVRYEIKDLASMDATSQELLTLYI